jgi:hypothetical protein
LLVWSSCLSGGVGGVWLLTVCLGPCDTGVFRNVSIVFCPCFNEFFFPLAFEFLVESVLENVTFCTLCNCSISSAVLSPSCVVLCISTVVVFCTVSVWTSVLLFSVLFLPDRIVSKRPQIQLRPHHFWTYTSNLTTVVTSLLNCMINGTTSILKS